MDIEREASVPVIHQTARASCLHDHFYSRIQVRTIWVFWTDFPLIRLVLWTWPLVRIDTPESDQVSRPGNDEGRYFYLFFREKKRAGAHGSYVDDLLRTGDREFKNFCFKMHERFETNRDELLPMTCSGFNIQRGTIFLYSMNRTFKEKRLQELHNSSSFSDFVQCICVSHG